jgi:hypothetical protein
MLCPARWPNNHIGDSRGGALTRSGTIDPTMTSDLKLRVGRAITPEQFERLSDEQLVRLLPRSVREFFPGKDFCADGTFYLHDGTVWSFYKGGYLDA